MIGLMTSMWSSASRSIWAADHSNHSRSSVTTSRMTLLSTRMSAIFTRRKLIASGQSHDLVRGKPRRGFPPHGLEETLPAAPGLSRFPQNDRAAPQSELYFRIGKEAGLLAEIYRDGDLAFARDPHDVSRGCGLTSQSKT